MVSARLLAAGTPRRERLHALSLLGLLFDHVDAGGEVRVSLDDLVGEFELPRTRVEEALEALVRVGAVRRGPERLVLVGRQPPLSGSLRLSAFLANVAVVLDDEHAEPVPADPVRSPVFLADAPADAAENSRRQRRLRPRQPALAALALTGVVLLAALGPPSPAPTRLRSVGSPPAATTLDSSSGRSESSDARESEPDGSGQVEGGESRAGGSGESSSSPARVPMDASAAPNEDRRPGDQRPAAPGTEGSTGQEAPPPPGSRRVTTPPQDSVQGPPPPSSVAPSPAVPTPAVSCPAGVPRIDVGSIAVVPAGPDVVGGVPTTSVIEVRGSLVNPTRAATVIRSFEVIIRSGVSTVAVPSTGPLDVAPDGRREWTVRTPAGATPATPPSVESARIVDWGWQDAQLGRSCPI